MKIALNLNLAWPDVKDVYDVGFDGCCIGRVWLAGDRAGSDSPWEWLISIPMTLPDSTKGRAKSLNDALGAFATAWSQVISATPAPRLERALALSRATDPRPFAVAPAAGQPQSVTSQLAATSPAHVEHQTQLETIEQATANPPQAATAQRVEKTASSTSAPNTVESSPERDVLPEPPPLPVVPQMPVDSLSDLPVVPRRLASEAQPVAEIHGVAQITPIDAIAPSSSTVETAVPTTNAVETKSKQVDYPAQANLGAGATNTVVAAAPITIVKPPPAQSAPTVPQPIPAPIIAVKPPAAPAKPTILPGKVAMMPVSNLNIQLGGGKNVTGKLKPQITVRKSVIPAPQIVVTKANAVVAKLPGVGSSASPTVPPPKTAAPAAPAVLAAPQAVKLAAPVNNGTTERVALKPAQPPPLPKQQLPELGGALAQMPTDSGTLRDIEDLLTRHT